VDINKQYNYQPHTGGAGPTKIQLSVLNDLLKQVLTENNIAYTIIEGDDHQELISVEGRQAGYDRFGYASDDAILDQVDLQDAFRYLAYKHMTMKQLACWVREYADDEEACDLFHEYRENGAAEREQYGDPEDSPCLEDPWWKNP